MIQGRRVTASRRASRGTRGGTRLVVRGPVRRVPRLAACVLVALSALVSVSALAAPRGARRAPAKRSVRGAKARPPAPPPVVETPPAVEEPAPAPAPDPTPQPAPAAQTFEARP